MKSLESKVRKAKNEYETLKAEYEALKSLNWDIFYGREEGVHDLKKENDLRKQLETAQKKMEQLEGFLKAKKETQ
jgi:predicted RNase H-like nuclease (RuvC/YqgF family)